MVSQTEFINIPPWLPQHCIGGHPALDLVNTISHRLDPVVAIDRLNATVKIASWLVYQGLLTEPQSQALLRLGHAPSTEAALIAAVAELRYAAAQLFTAVAQQIELPYAALHQILQSAAHGDAVLLAVPDDDRAACHLSFRRMSVEGIAAALALLVLDGVFRLPKTRIRACPRCGWLFCDRSKGGRRRWCSMRECGNREKVSRYYHQQRNR